ncbi:unnamed protein product, partial [Polarella glacialis]
IVLDKVSCTAGISACEKGSMWHQALVIFRSMPCMRVSRDEISSSAAVAAAEKGRQWQLVLELLNEQPGHFSLADVMSDLWKPTNSNNNNDDNNDNNNNDNNDKNEARGPPTAARLAQLSWRLAKQPFSARRSRDGEGSSGGNGERALATAEWLAEKATLKVRDFTPQELSSLIWSLATLSVANKPLMQAAGQTVIARGREFSLARLASLSWAFATLG